MSVNALGEVAIHRRSVALPYCLRFASIPQMARTLDPLLSQLRQHQETGLQFNDAPPLGIANVWEQENMVQVIWSTKATTIQSWSEFKRDFADKTWKAWVVKMKARNNEIDPKFEYEFHCQALPAASLKRKRKHKH